MTNLSFLCVGQPKAATTTLHRILSQLDGFGLPGSKELNFLGTPSKFCTPLDGSTRELVYKQYWNLVKGNNPPDNIRYWGEVSTTYLARAPKVIQSLELLRIRPDHFIFCIREPFKRLRSHCLHLMYFYGIEKNDLKDALESDFGDILSSSMLNKNIDAYRFDLTLPGSSKFHIIEFDAFTRDPKVAVEQLMSNMGIDVSCKHLSPSYKSGSTPRYKPLGYMHHKIAARLAASNKYRFIYNTKLVRGAAEFVHRLNSVPPSDDVEEAIKSALMPYLPKLEDDYLKLIQRILNRSQSGVNVL